jgi:glycosyltransferase involved in cell wall biosynthesis
LSLRVTWVTNIPAPYRNHRYRRMRAVFPGMGIDFEVYYMAWSEPDRHWRFTEQDLDHPHKVFGSIHLPGLGPTAHISPRLLAALARWRGDVLVVGGWGYPTSALAPFVAGSRPLRVLESESNLESSRLRSSPARYLKGSLVSRYDAFLVPGARARELLEWLAPAVASRPFAEFPNLVDEAVFADGVARLRRDREGVRRELGASPERQLWVCPARLETFKGLHTLLPLLEGVKTAELWVAGDGSQRAALQETIERHALPVRLLGQKDEAAIVRLYAAADLFVLPSLSDPSPLSAVEACAARLPLLVSRRIGNFPDVLEDGVNGWAYDPEAPERHRERVRAIASLSRQELAAMGERSGERFARRFDSTRCIERVGRFFLETHRALRPQRG